jgi:hypothetical protein
MRLSSEPSPGDEMYPCAERPLQSRLRTSEIGRMSKVETITIPTKDLNGSRLRCLMLTSLPESHVAKVTATLCRCKD